MPKNKGKGGKHRRKGKGTNNLREMVYKEEGQVYAQAKRMLGDARVEADCFDGKTRICIIRGSMRKKQWIGQGDVLLVQLRSFQDEKADVVLRYTNDETRLLRREGHLPSTFDFQDNSDDSNDHFEFARNEEPEEKPKENLAQNERIGELPPSDDDVNLDEL